MIHDGMSCGRTICRELGHILLTGDAFDKPLPPFETAQLFCEWHQLHALYASAISLRRTLSADYQPLMMQGMRLTAKQMKIDTTEAELSRRFTDAGIRHIVLKGSHTRSFYPRELSRTSADIDWQIAPDDVERAEDVLLADGWTRKTADTDERCYEKAPRARLELHIAPEGFHPSQQRVMQAMLDRAVRTDGTQFRLNDSDAYVYAVFHAYKHFVLAGAGVRMFLDIHAIGTHGDLDRDDIKENLTALNCEGFEACVRRLNSVLFDGADSDDDLDALIRYIFTNGAYGDKAAQLALEPLNASVANRSRFRRFTSNYGLDMGAMKTRYPCLRRAIVLYPFCMVHRICHGMRHRRAVLRQAVSDRNEQRRQRDDLRRILELASVL